MLNAKEQHATLKPGVSTHNDLADAGAYKEPAFKARQVQDVLLHFARHGLDTSPKLVHCVSPEADQRVSAMRRSAATALQHTVGPYDLWVVPRSKLPASYYTVSATGVVEVLGGNNPSVHTSVCQWLRHASLHQLLAALPAGQHMLKGAALHRWLAAARRQRFARCRQVLSQQLLQLKPMFHRMFSDVRAKLAQLHVEGPLAAIEEGVTKLDTLVSQQQEYQQSRLAPLLARIIGVVAADVEQLAQRLQSSERLLRREVEDYKKDPSAGASQGLCSVKVKAERAAIVLKHTAAKQDLQHMPCFLQLLAQVILQSQLDLLVGAVEGLHRHMTSPGNHLHVDLLLRGPEGVSMSPSQDETLKALSKGVLEHMVGVLLAAPRLLKHHSIAALMSDPVNATVSITGKRDSVSGSCFVSCSGGSSSGAAPHMGSAVVSGKALKAAAAAAAQAAAAVTLSTWLMEGEGQEGRREGGQLLMMVVGDKMLQAKRRALDQQVMRSFREAQQVADALMELSVLLKFACMWDPKAYKARQHTVGSLRKDMLLIKEWQAQLQVVLDSQCVGMLKLETGSLKATFTNTLSSAQATIAMMLVVASRRSAEATIDKLHNVSSDLAHQPSRLPDFIRFRQVVRGIRQQQEDLLVSLPAQVADLYAVVTGWGFRLPHTDQALMDDLREACRRCSAALTAAVAFLDSRQLGMVALLDRQAKDVLRQAQELLKTLEDAAMAQRLMSAKDDPINSAKRCHVDAAELTSWQLQLEQLSSTAELVNEQEQLLDMRCTQYDNLLEARRVLLEMQQQAGRLHEPAHAAD